MDKKTIDNFYVSRLIDSLEKDYEKWKVIGYDYTDSYCNIYHVNEYQGVEYKNKKGETLKFTLSHDFSAIVNGVVSWSIPFLSMYNIFSYRTRRLLRASNKMKKYTKNKQKEEQIKKLLNAL